MNEASLAAKQKMLKSQLMQRTRQTLVSLILEETGHSIQKLTRRHQTPSSLFSALLIASLVLLIDILVSFFHGEFRSSARGGFVPIEILMAGAICALLITLKKYFDSLFSIIRERIIDNIQDVTSLIDLQTWLDKVWDTKRTLLFGTFCMVVGFSYFFIPIVIFGEPASSLFGAFIMGAVLFFIAGIALYYFYRILILPLHLSQYSFRIYDLDPRNSEIIENISNLITTFGYIVAAFMAVTTATLVLIGWTALPAMAPTILTAWVLIIALFVTNHYALNKIITKAK